MKIIAFAASSSRKSINKQLVTYAAEMLEDAQVEILDLNDYELPLFSEDKEAEIGQPALAQDFLAKISQSDGVMISFAEHNGSYTVAYKNLFDWSSRITRDIFANKPMVMLATSPGPGGAGRVLAMAVASAATFAGDVKASLSIPSFYENFDVESGSLNDSEIKAQLVDTVRSLL